MSKRFDIAIIGAGPAGHTAALRLGAAGKSVVLFEKESLGGVCLREGCIPSKLFLHSTNLYKNCTDDISEYGIENNNAVYYHNSVIKRKNDVVKRLEKAIEYKLKRANVTIVYEAAFVKKYEDNDFVLYTATEEYESDKLIIAVGSSLVAPYIKGLVDVVAKGKAYYTKDALLKKVFPKTMVIVGGGVSGIEFAMIFNNLGVRVTVVEKSEHLLPDSDLELSETLLMSLEESGIDFCLNTTVEEISDRYLLCKKDDESVLVGYDEILLCTGRKPILRAIGIEEDCAKKGIEGLHVIGDALSKGHLAHSAIAEAECISDYIISGRLRELDYDNIPTVVYVHPETAYTGLDERKALERGVNAVTVSVPIEASGRFHAENKSGYGLFKLVFDNDEHTIIGAFIISDYASEIIELCHTFIKLKTKAEDIAELVFPHPTNGELIHEAVLQFLRK